MFHPLRHTENSRLHNSNTNMLWLVGDLCRQALGLSRRLSRDALRIWKPQDCQTIRDQMALCLYLKMDKGPGERRVWLPLPETISIYRQPG